MLQICSLGSGIGQGVRVGPHWGFLDTPVEGELILRAPMTYFTDPVFRPRRKRLGERWATRHCVHARTDGYIICNKLLDGNVSAVSLDGQLLPSVVSGDEFYLNFRSNKGERTFAPYGEEGYYKIIWNTQSRSESLVIIRVALVGGAHNNWAADWFVVAIPIEDESPCFGDMQWHYGTLASGVSETHADEVARRWVSRYYQWEDGYPVTWATYRFYWITNDREIPTDAISAFLDSLGTPFLGRHLPSFDLTLFYDAVDNFRPTMLSFLETAVGWGEMPSLIQDFFSKTLQILGLKRKQDLTVKLLCGLYLMWIYAVKPTPEDIKIVSEWLKTLTSPLKFDGARLSSRRSYITTCPFGTIDYWQQAAIQLKGLQDPMPVDLNEALDLIEESGTLRAGHSLALGGGAGTEGLTTLYHRLADILPLSPGAVGEQLWNYLGYSFVVDWFLPVGETLHRSDIRNYLSFLAVDYACMTTKAQCDAGPYFRMEFMDRFGLEIMADVHIKFYERSYKPKVPKLPTFSYECSSINHWWMQGAALLTQRFL